MARNLPGTLLWLVPLALSGCFDPVEAPSAYASETYLCDAQHAAEFAQRVDRCRASRLNDPKSCAGVVSFRGTLQGIDVVVDAELEQTEVRNIMVGATAYRDRLKMSGTSPYFLFDLVTNLVGGSEAPMDPSRTLSIVPAVEPGRQWYDDTRADVEIGLIAGTTSDIQFTQGELILERQSIEETIGSFVGENARGDTMLQGCFHAFTSGATLEFDEP